MAGGSPCSVALGTVLVTGGCGFLGSHIVDQLLNFPSEAAAKGLDTAADATIRVPSTQQDFMTYQFPSLRGRYPSYEKTSVHVLDLRCVHNRFPGVTYHDADITDISSLLSVFRTVKPDVVINTASGMYDAPKDILRKVNIEGTRALVEVAGGLHGDWAGKCKAFVHTSSASVVHDGRSDLNFADETWPYVCPNPVEYYSETKVHAEKTVLSANRIYNGMLTCAIRPAAPIGERDRGSLTHGLLSTAKAAPSWQLQLQLGTGDNLFDTTYVGNIAYAHLLVANFLLATHSRAASGQAAPLSHEKVDGEAFNVTNNEPMYFWDTSRYFWTAYGREINQERLVALGETFAYAIGALAEMSSFITGRKTKMNRQTVKYACMTRTYTCDKLKQRCGYRPVVGIEEALQRSVKSFLLNDQAAENANGQVKKVQ